MQKKVTCLIDTNILIQFEEADQNTGVLKESFAEVFNLCQKYEVTLLHHPASEEDINRDMNVPRREMTLSSKSKYPELEHPPLTTIDKLEELFGGIKNENDRVDCLILYALYRNCTDFVITEDGGLHRRGAREGVELRDRIFSISELKSWLIRNFEPQKVELPLVQDLPMYSLDKEDKIFDSLRDVYTNNDGFNNWFDKCCREHRKAWVIYGEDDKIGAICIYNLDDEYKDRVEEMGEKPLKLCTFKVSEDHRGTKLGELLLKTALLYGIENEITSLWLTAFGGQQVQLIHFLKDFGFVVGDFLNQNNEDILYKPFYAPADVPEMDPLDFHKLYWPDCYENEEINKYIIPIIPEYHEVLFPELSENTVVQLPLFDELKDCKIPGNTIKKVYLCHSPTKNIPNGSLLLFYRSRDEKNITTMGIVEKVHRISNFSEMIRVIGKRSVYSLEEVTGMLSKETLVIEFRFVKHYKQKVSYDSLIENNILKGPPISISLISSDSYNTFKGLI